MRPACAILILCLAPVLGRGEDSRLSEADLKKARKIYLSKCAKCHKMHEPAGYDDAGWAGWMAKMKAKSKLKEDQYELLLRYTETLRPNGRGGAGK